MGAATLKNFCHNGLLRAMVTHIRAGMVWGLMDGTHQLGHPKGLWWPTSGQGHPEQTVAGQYPCTDLPQHYYGMAFKEARCRFPHRSAGLAKLHCPSPSSTGKVLAQEGVQPETLAFSLHGWQKVKQGKGMPPQRKYGIFYSTEFKLQLQHYCNDLNDHCSFRFVERFCLC